jgi:hypothetical protein
MAGAERAAACAHHLSAGRTLPVDSAQGLKARASTAAVHALVELDALRRDGALAPGWQLRVFRHAAGAAAGACLGAPRVPLPLASATLRLDAGFRAVIDVDPGGDLGAAGLCVAGIAADPAALAPCIDVVLAPQARGSEANLCFHHWAGRGARGCTCRPALGSPLLPALRNPTSAACARPDPLLSSQPTQPWRYAAVLVSSNGASVLRFDAVRRALRAAGRGADADALEAGLAAARAPGADAAAKAYSNPVEVELQAQVWPAGAGRAPTLLHSPDATLMCKLRQRKGVVQAGRCRRGAGGRRRLPPRSSLSPRLLSSPALEPRRCRTPPAPTTLTRPPARTTPHPTPGGARPRARALADHVAAPEGRRAARLDARGRRRRRRPPRAARPVLRAVLACSPPGGWRPAKPLLFEPRPPPPAAPTRRLDRASPPRGLTTAPGSMRCAPSSWP